MEDNRQIRMDTQVKKSIDARTKEFREKLAKLTYEKIKQKLQPSPEPLKGYPHNESMLEDAYEMNENADVDKDIAYLQKLDKEDPKKAAAFRKRTNALKKGGGWNLQQKSRPDQVKTLKDMEAAAKKKHPALYRKEEVLESVDENADYDKDIAYLQKLDKTDPQKAAAFRKRTNALKKGGGWNLQQKPTPAQVKTLKDMEAAAKKKHPALYLKK